MADFQLGESRLNTRKLPYAIIDGKQRLESIFDFFSGTLVLNDDFVWRADHNLKLGGLSLKDLRARHAIVAEAFETETIDIMSVVTDNEDDINELFVRLNRSKPLTGAEIRNAMVGPVSDVIRSVAQHPFFSENIRFSVVRAGDYNTAAKIVLFEYLGKPVSTKKKDLDAFARNKGIESGRMELAARRALDVLDNMQEVFLPRDELLSSAGPVPVYYWLVREMPFENQTVLREFLLAFERERRLNRVSQIKGTLDEEHPSFARYDALNRSINDVGSHVGRFEILWVAFREWLGNQSLSSHAKFVLKH
jgi:predicted nucleotidyltransferase